MTRRLVIKLLLGVALCVVVMDGAVWLTRPTPPPRKGMSRGEVHAALGKPVSRDRSGDGRVLKWQGVGPLADSVDFYSPEPDAFGNRSMIAVYYINDTVVACEVQPRGQNTPTWLRRLHKAIGW
jgi:hypothetical protein